VSSSACTNLPHISNLHEAEFNLGLGSEDARSLAPSQPSLHLTLDSQTQHTQDWDALPDAPQPAGSSFAAAAAAAVAAVPQEQAGDGGVAASDGEAAAAPADGDPEKAAAPAAAAAAPAPPPCTAFQEFKPPAQAKRRAFLGLMAAEPARAARHGTPASSAGGGGSGEDEDATDVAEAASGGGSGQEGSDGEDSAEGASSNSSSSSSSDSDSDSEEEEESAGGRASRQVGSECKRIDVGELLDCQSSVPDDHCVHSFCVAHLTRQLHLPEGACKTQLALLPWLMAHIQSRLDTLSA